MSLQMIIVEKSGILRPLHVKQFDVSSIYKKCGFKQMDHFTKQHQWQCNSYTIELYGKSVGRASNMNNYAFQQCPSTIYGNCALIAKEYDHYVHLSIDHWKELECQFDPLLEEKVDDNDNEEMNNEMKDDVLANENEIMHYNGNEISANNCFEHLVPELEEEPYLI